MRSVDDPRFFVMDRFLASLADFVGATPGPELEQQFTAAWGDLAVLSQEQVGHGYVSIMNFFMITGEVVKKLAVELLVRLVLQAAPDAKQATFLIGTAPDGGSWLEPDVEVRTTRGDRITLSWERIDPADSASLYVALLSQFDALRLGPNTLDLKHRALGARGQ